MPEILAWISFALQVWTALPFIPSFSRRRGTRRIETVWRLGIYERRSVRTERYESAP